MLAVPVKSMFRVFLVHGFSFGQAGFLFSFHHNGTDRSLSVFLQNSNRNGANHAVHPEMILVWQNYDSCHTEELDSMSLFDLTSC